MQQSNSNSPVIKVKVPPVLIYQLIMRYIKHLIDIDTLFYSPGPTNSCKQLLTVQQLTAKLYALCKDLIEIQKLLQLFIQTEQQKKSFFAAFGTWRSADDLVQFLKNNKAIRDAHIKGEKIDTTGFFCLYISSPIYDARKRQLDIVGQIFGGQVKLQFFNKNDSMPFFFPPKNQCSLLCTINKDYKTDPDNSLFVKIFIDNLLSIY